MNHDAEHRSPWVDRLSDYVDDDLSPAERDEVDRHLETCGECRAIVEDLRRVVMMAGRLDKAVPPPRDLWPGIAGRLTPRRRGTWFSLGTAWVRPQLAALAVFIGCVALLWLAAVRLGPFRQQAGVAPVSVARPSHGTDSEYEETVARLRREAEERLTLDPHVVEVLDENLATLDAAIAAYRDALAAEPGDQQLRSRLVAARETKLQVLQQAVALAPEGSE
jgi:anti-sigma factor RsiW